MTRNRDDRVTMEIFIHNLTRAQAVAIEDMLATWQQGGSLGCSRWTAFYADGDGNFRPACVVNGHVARHQRFVPMQKFWTGGEAWRGEYRVDFDPIAAAMHAEDARLFPPVSAASEVGNASDAVDPQATDTGKLPTRV